MKKFILGMAAVISLAACNDQNGSPTTHPSAPSSSASEEGGISSGGGGTLPAEPASIFDIKDHIRDAKRDLRLYFLGQKFSAQNDETPNDLDRKLLLQKTSVLEVLEKTDLELRMDKPCYDSAGKEVDGSIYASRPNTICISAFKIAPKVPKELARTEVLGLIAHELSHLVGASEEEAVAFQRELVFSFKYFKVEEKTTELLVDSMYDSASKIRGDLKDIIEKYGSLSDQELEKQLEDVTRDLSNFESMRWTLPFSFYLRPQWDYSDIQGTRFRVGLWFVSSLTWDKQGNYWRDLLDKVFQSDTELSADEFNKRHMGMGGSFGPNSWPQEKIKRINSRAEFLPVLSQLQKYFEDQANYFWSFKFSNPFPKLLVGPWNQVTENPWKKFVGEFEVVDRQCITNGYDKNILSWRTGFLIREEPNSDLVILRELTQSGWGESSLYDNGSVVLASAVVSVSGDEKSATRIAESGQMWFGGWSRSVESLQATDTGYIWKMRIDSKEQYTDVFHSAACTLTLKKK